MIGGEVFLSGAAVSVRNAADMVVAKYDKGIIGHNTDTKRDRLRTGIAAALKREGKWAEDDDLSSLLQKYPT
ncbi:hypothetical protein [Ruegeria sp.]|uniref:hypothetical protein n=1 Tax=Ruegeria sp. TaxID=1879320 RepID=UPI003AFF6AFE